MQLYLLEFIKIDLTVVAIGMVFGGMIWLATLPFKGRRGGVYAGKGF